METIASRHIAIEEITQNIPRLVNKEQNDALLHPITQEEVNDTMQQTPVSRPQAQMDSLLIFFIIVGISLKLMCGKLWRNHEKL